MWIQGRLTLLPRVVQHFVKSLHWWQHAGGSWVTNSAPVSTGVCSSSSPVILWISASICLLRHDFNTHTLKYCLCSFTTNYFFFFLCYSQGSIFFFFKVLCVGRLFPLWVSIQHSKGLMKRCLKGWRLRNSVLISLIVFSFSPPLPRTSQKEIPPLHPPTRRTKEPSVSSGSPNSSPWAIHTRVRAHMHIFSSTRQTIAWSLWNC